ncbi:MAG TPA: cytochrome c [Gemmatimonadales bacterium]
MTRYSVLLLLPALVAGCQTTRTAAAGPTPQATEQDVAAGRELYHGLGACAGCHGENGVGTPDGPELVGGVWEQGDGSMEWLVHMTRHGGLGVRSRSGDPQAMRGPTVLDSAQVRQVAAYVWSISRDRRAPAAPDS